jgi:D-xylose transport system substrate-binding protein
VSVKSVLLVPEWVTPTSVQSTVVQDAFVPASQICTGSFAADCTTYGIH